MKNLNIDKTPRIKKCFKIVGKGVVKKRKKKLKLKLTEKKFVTLSTKLCSHILTGENNKKGEK